MENFAPVQKFGYLRPRPARGRRRASELYIPQHPAGDPTRDRDDQRPGREPATARSPTPPYDGYATDSDVSYYCDTEGGSSGSPVLSRKTNKVVALHHFGGCPNSGVRIDLIYTKIKSLL